MVLWIAFAYVVGLAMVLLFLRGAALASRDLSERAEQQSSIERVA